LCVAEKASLREENPEGKISSLAVSHTQMDGDADVLQRNAPNVALIMPPPSGCSRNTFFPGKSGDADEIQLSAVQDSPYIISRLGKGSRR
jgi:hypothetical protein